MEDPTTDVIQSFLQLSERKQREMKRPAQEHNTQRDPGIEHTSSHALTTESYMPSQ